jgi:hypothetical protein
VAELLDKKPSNLPPVDIGALNLLCASDLSKLPEPKPEDVSKVLDSWSQHVRSETARHLYRFDQHPKEFENSPGFFRMLMLAVVLAEDYGIQYDPRRRAMPGAPITGDGFFADPDAVFITGLLGSRHIGTCSSLPVLYVAIGRRLGYPLKLVTTKGHLFVRWDGNGERFNIEAAGNGVNRFDDDYYRHWPFEIIPEEEKAEGYLQSMTPAQELACFLSVRGMCQKEAGDLKGAAESFAAAAKFAPQCESYGRMQRNLQQAAAQAREIATSATTGNR